MVWRLRLAGRVPIRTDATLMSWVYKQTTGQLWRNAVLIGLGYSGYPPGKNRPEFQQVHDVGPIPQGEWDIGPPHDTQTHGPHVMSLTPSQETETWGRSNFLIHGDSILSPGLASRGCVILARHIRDEISESGDHELQVIA